MVQWQKTGWRRIAGLLTLVVLVVCVPGGRAQDDEAQRALYNVEQWLKQELGKPNLILIDYSYQGTSWPDSSMGCPAADGVTVQPGIVYGYQWSLLYDNMVRYEVHSTLDGTQAVLCYTTNAAPAINLVTYTTTTFTILAPEAWLTFPNAARTIVLFAPQQQLSCAQPGMRVTALGRVASGITPDQLLDEYLAQGHATEDDPAARMTVGTFGRSTLFKLTCEGGTQQWRVSSFVQYGTAYRVEQWADSADFERWAAVFLTMLGRLGPPETVIETATPTSPTDGTPAPTLTETAPTPLPALPLAHVFVGDVFLGALNDIPGRSITTIPTDQRYYLTFSPDGLRLAYIDATHAQLRLLDVGSKSPRLIAEAVDPAFPPAWQTDSQQIAYVAPAAESTAGEAGLREVRIIPAAGGEAQTLVSFAFDNTCPAPDGDPASAVLASQTGPGAALAWLADGQFLVSTRCDGGLARLNPADGVLTPLGGDLLSGALSPDRMRYAARTPGGFALIELTTGARTDISAGAGVQQIAWGPDGQTVYFSLAVPSGSLTLNDPAQQARGEAIFGMWPVTITSYALTLTQLDLRTNAQTPLWTGAGRGIGGIAPAPDHSGVLFCVTPGGSVVAEAFQAGADALAIRRAWPLPGLYWLPTGGTTPRVLAFSTQPVFAPVTIPAAQ